MAEIPTTAGPVDSSELGRTLVHEHLLSASEPVRVQWPHLHDAEAEFRYAVDEVNRAMGHGVRTIVDPACMDLARDARFATRVAEETGVQLILCTGIYGQHYTFLPHYFQSRGEDHIADAFVHDIEVGIQGTDVKAAFLKVAADQPGITEDVRKTHVAAARASHRTGKPIMAHSHPASETGLAQMEIFLEEGVAPEKVQIAHTGDTDDLDYIERLLATGCYIGMDRYGLDIYLPQAQRNATVIALCERGYAERMTLSQDYCATLDWFPREMIEQMAPKWSMTLLFEEVLGELAEGGVTDEHVSTMLDRNPAAWLTS